jgi:hypothetical protein
MEIGVIPPPNLGEIPAHLREIFDAGYVARTRQYDVFRMLHMFHRVTADASPKECETFLRAVVVHLRFHASHYDQWVVEFAGFLDEEKIQALTIPQDLFHKIRDAYQARHKTWIKLRYHYDFDLRQVRERKRDETTTKATGYYFEPGIEPHHKTHPVSRHNWAVNAISGNLLRCWRQNPHLDQYEIYARLWNNAANILNQELLGPLFKNQDQLQYRVPRALPPVEKTENEVDNYLSGLFADCANGFDKDLADLSARDQAFAEALDSYLKIGRGASLQTLRDEERFMLDFEKRRDITETPEIFRDHQQDPQSGKIDLHRIELCSKIKDAHDILRQDSVGIYAWLTGFHSRRRKDGVHLHGDCYLSKKEFVYFVRQLTDQMEDAGSDAAMTKIREGLQSVEHWIKPLMFGDKKIDKSKGPVDKNRIGNFGCVCPCYTAKGHQHPLNMEGPPDEDERMQARRREFQAKFQTDSLNFHVKLTFKPCNGFFNFVVADQVNLTSFKKLLETNLTSQPELGQRCLEAIKKRMSPPVPLCLRPVHCPMCDYPNIATEAIKNHDTCESPDAKHPSDITCLQCTSRFCLYCKVDHFTEKKSLCRGRPEFENSVEIACISCEIAIYRVEDTCPLVRCKNCIKDFCTTCFTYRKGHGFRHSCPVNLVYKRDKPNFPTDLTGPNWTIRANGDAVYDGLWRDEAKWHGVEIFDRVVEANDEYMIRARA